MPDCALALYLSEKVFFFDYIEHSVGCGTSQRVAAKGGAMRSGLKKVCVGFGHPDSADGNPPAQAFGHADGVGPDSGCFVGEEVSGTSDPALNFIQNEEYPTFIAECAEFTKKTGFRRKDTTFALNGFDEYRSYGIVDQSLETLNVIELAEAEALQHRAEAGLDLFLWCGSHAAKGASMEGIVGTDDLVAAAFFVIALLATVQTGQFDQSFVGFGAAVAEKDASGACALDESIGQFRLAGDSVKVAAMRQSRGLFLNGPDPFWM